MNLHQEKIFEIMIQIDKLCRKYNIKYSLLGGTMLGAYRHKGFIPWDDDADIGIPDYQYDYFLEVAYKELPEPFIIRDIKLEKDIPYNFAHVENKNTTCIEQRKSGTGYVGGIYVEIFPLHGCPNNKMLRWIFYYKIKLLKKIMYTLTLDKNSKKRGFLKNSIIEISRRFLNLNFITQKIRKEIKRKKIDSCNYYCNLLGKWEEKETFKKDMFSFRNEYEFEGYSFFGVSEPIKYLTQMYGKDFMIPPSKEKMKYMEHPHLILDLDLSYKNYKSDKN